MRELRNNTKTHLESLGIPVHSSKISPTQLKNLPVIVLYNDKMNIQNDIPNCLGVGGPVNVSLNIDVVISYSGNFADQLDMLVEQVIDSISDPLYLANNWNNLDNISVAYQYVSEFEVPLAIATINLSGTKFK